MIYGQVNKLKMQLEILKKRTHRDVLNISNLNTRSKIIPSSFKYYNIYEFFQLEDNTKEQLISLIQFKKIDLK